MHAERYADCWFAIDANNMLYKDVCTGDITATRFTARLRCLNRQWRPERVIVAFDPDDGSSFRREMYSLYKSGRGPKPDGLAHAIGAAKQACYDECVDCVTVPTFEADDVIATVVNGALAVDRRVVMFSGDKDLRQLLLAGRVTQCTALTRYLDRLSGIWLTEGDMMPAAIGSLPPYGARAEQWVEYQMLAGDQGDSIKGVPGIGKAYASQLLHDYATIENLCRRNEGNDKASARIKKIIAARDNGTLDLMRELVTLRSDVPISSAMMEMEVPA